MITATLLGVAALTAVAPVPPPMPPGLIPLIDDSGAIVVAVPESWADVETTPTDVGGSPRPSITASTDLAQFRSTFDVPGMSYTAFPFVAEVLDVVDVYGAAGACTTTELKAYDDPIVSGVVQIGTECGPQSFDWRLVVASPADQSFTAVLQIQSPAGDEAMNQVLLTFNVTGAPMPPTAVLTPTSTTVA